MTQDQIQEAARYAYCRGATSESLFHLMWNSQPSCSIGWSRDELISFAQSVAAAEREACAEVCDDKVDAEYKTGKVDHNEMGWTQSCAISIRQRGQA